MEEKAAPEVKRVLITRFIGRGRYAHRYASTAGARLSTWQETNRLEVFRGRNDRTAVQ